MSRREDADDNTEVISGLMVNSERKGNNIPGGTYYIATPDPITIGSTPVTWEQYLPGGWPTPHAYTHSPQGSDPIPELGALSSALPSDPVNGQVVFLPTGQEGVTWQFRYNGLSTSDKKWEFIGGPPVVISSNNSRNLNNQTTYANLPTDPLSFTLPSVIGDYNIKIESNILPISQGSGSLSYSVGATSASDDWALFYAGAAVTAASTSKETKHVNVASGAVIAEKGKTGGNYVVNFDKRRITITPVRIK